MTNGLWSYFKSNFAPAFFLLNKERRLALRVLYSVFRYLDDVVDSNHPQALSILSAWREAFLSGSEDRLPPGSDAQRGGLFFPMAKKYDLPLSSMIDFIDKGLMVDLRGARFETPMETESYCYGVAGCVGVACLPLFGVPVLEAKPYAIRLGIAVQWVNILRDVGGDAAINRLYLPLDRLKDFGLSEADVMAQKNSDAFQNFMQNEARVATGHFKRADELLPAAWASALRPAVAMGAIYKHLLGKIEQQRFPVFERRVKLTFLEKARVMWPYIKG